MLLNNKVVIITGASEGIGREAALLFAEEGASVVLAARRGGLLAKVLDELKDGPQRHMSCPTDISKAEDVKALVSKVIEKYGRIDVLVNNAAVSHIGRVRDLDLERAENVLNINLIGTIRVTREVLPHMIKQKSGHIITISSVLGKRGVSYRSIYCASKFGVEGFIESLRSEVDKHNIKISIVRPSTVRTDFSNKIRRDSDVTHHALDSIDPATVAKTIVDVAKRPKRDVNMGLLAKGFLFLNTISSVLVDEIVKER